MTNYAIDDADGQNISQGMHNHDGRIRSRAQKMADERGENVLLYRESGPDEGIDDEVFEPRA